MRTIDKLKLISLIAAARESERQRTIFRLHEHDEPVQRMVNALVPGTYIPPHEHSTPPKVELLSILVGRIAVICFEPSGDLAEVHWLDSEGPLRVVDIAPGEIHSMIAVTPAAVLEIVQGPYDPETHKQFAPFAPAENTPEARDYIVALTEQVMAFSASDG